MHISELLILIQYEFKFGKCAAVATCNINKAYRKGNVNSTILFSSFVLKMNQFKTYLPVGRE